MNWNEKKIDKFMLIFDKEGLNIYHLIREGIHSYTARLNRRKGKRIDIYKNGYEPGDRFYKPYIVFDDYVAAKTFYLKLLQKYFDRQDVLSVRFILEMDQIVREIKILQINERFNQHHGRRSP